MSRFLCLLLPGVGRLVIPACGSGNRYIILGNVVLALLDSGSQVNVIRLDLAQELELEMMPDP